MGGWHHQLSGHESEQTPGNSEGQGSLACCSPRGCKESDMTEQQSTHTYMPREEPLNENRKKRSADRLSPGGEKKKSNCKIRSST